MTQKVVSDNNDIIYLEKKVRSICNGSHSLLLDSIFKKNSPNLQNSKILYQFIIIEYENENTQLNTTLSHIKIISQFNVFSNCKDFDKITKNDISCFLNSSRKNELEDPTHKWIGTYNTRHMVLSKFFRWYYNYFQNNEADQKKWVTPICMQGIKQLARKEKSAYKPSDMWIEEDHALFLKYCPEKRDRCFHAMANDTSARPNELLNLKIKDIKFKISSTNLQYAEVNITKSKTKPRTLPLIISIPYVKDWLDSHPFANNPDSYLFVSLSDNNFGNRLSGQAIYKSYTERYRKNYFPNLIKNNIPERDKSFIRNLLTKPWTPYIQRHSALTSKSLVLNEHTLRDHAGWTMSSKMPEIYLHYLGNESSKSLLEAYGIEDKNYNNNKKNILKSKPCPNCDEPNKPESKFCFRCKMVLTFDSYQEALEKQEEKDQEINEMKDQIQTIMNTLGDLVTNQNDTGKVAKRLIDSGYYISE